MNFIIINLNNCILLSEFKMFLNQLKDKDTVDVNIQITKVINNNLIDHTIYRLLRHDKDISKNFIEQFTNFIKKEFNSKDLNYIELIRKLEKLDKKFYILNFYNLEDYNVEDLVFKTINELPNIKIIYEI